MIQMKMMKILVSHMLLAIISAEASPTLTTAAEYRRRRAIVGGTDADPERFPYYTRLDYDGEFGCGGSLIARDFILTAAHCAFPSDLGSLSAVIGGHDYNDGTGFNMTVRAIFQHHAYDDAFTTSNDVALLQIDPIPAQLLDDMTFLTLTSDSISEGTSVEVVGMGQLEQDGEDAEVLQQVELTILSDEQCDLQYDGDIHRKSMICAGGKEGKDSCDGDSGGPLIVLGDTAEDDVQVGIVSFGQDCADPDFPGVYAEVSYLRPWIDSIVCLHSEHASENCEVTVDTDLGPIIFDKAQDICRDLPGAFYADWWNQFQRCDWLRQHGRAALYCYKNHEAWVQCPLTCHSCGYNEDDDYYNEGYEDDDDYYNEGFDDQTAYKKSSSQVTLILLILCVGIFCIQSCFYTFRCCRRSRERKTRDKLSDGPAPSYPQDP